MARTFARYIEMTGGGGGTGTGDVATFANKVFAAGPVRRSWPDNISSGGLTSTDSYETKINPTIKKKKIKKALI